MKEPTGDLCGKCDGPLSRRGFCKDVRCPFFGLWQDELPSPEVIRQKRQVVGNKRSKKAYRFGSVGFWRNLRAIQGVLFRNDTEAEEAGYKVREG